MKEEFQKSLQEREGLPGNYTGMRAGYSEGHNRKDIVRGSDHFAAFKGLENCYLILNTYNDLISFIS